MSGVAHFFVVVGGSKIHERMAHFFIDIYSALSFEQGQEVEQLQDMEASVRLLQSFCSLLKLTKEIDPEYKKRLSEFILEQLNILGHAAERER